jgi:hypothetical protein
MILWKMKLSHSEPDDKFNRILSARSTIANASGAI